MKGELKRTIMVYVDSYINDVPVGRIKNAADNEVRSFQSLIQLLMMIERGLNASKFPQAFEKLRTFGAGGGCTAVEDTARTHGENATFAIRILFRQNASWQGSVFWAEGEQEESFRSVLELIFLMDSALKMRKAKLS
jgi:hypothetical protein